MKTIAILRKNKNHRRSSEKAVSFIFCTDNVAMGILKYFISTPIRTTKTPNCPNQLTSFDSWNANIAVTRPATIQTASTPDAVTFASTPISLPHVFSSILLSDTLPCQTQSPYKNVTVRNDPMQGSGSLTSCTWILAAGYHNINFTSIMRRGHFSLLPRIEPDISTYPPLTAPLFFNHFTITTSGSLRSRLFFFLQEADISTVNHLSGICSKICVNIVHGNQRSRSRCSGTFVKKLYDKYTILSYIFVIQFDGFVRQRVLFFIYVSDKSSILSYISVIQKPKFVIQLFVIFIISREIINFTPYMIQAINSFFSSSYHIMIIIISCHTLSYILKPRGGYI